MLFIVLFAVWLKLEHKYNDLLLYFGQRKQRNIPPISLSTSAETSRRSSHNNSRYIRSSDGHRLSVEKRLSKSEHKEKAHFKMNFIKTILRDVLITTGVMMISPMPSDKSSGMRKVKNERQTRFGFIHSKCPSHYN